MPTERPNYWYDATLTVRVYLPGFPPDDTEDVEFALTGLLDGVNLDDGLLLSVHDIELGEPYGFMEVVPDAPSAPAE